MKVELRKWNLSYAQDLQSAADNIKIASKLRDAFPHPFELEHATEYITRCRQLSDRVSFCRAIVIDGKAVGMVSIMQGEDIYSTSAELDFFLAEEYWGNGIMTSVIRAISSEAFRHMDICRIHALPFFNNTPARKVLEKAGFKLECVLKNAYVKHGEVGDLCLYAIVKK